ncbi:MAG: FAD:protein FMN transferase, partial [Rikenellaceae bacterium]|nr:FAD:protein FMN transferase [Rikenellaceae bacterium]
NIDSLLQFVGYQKLSIENGRLRKADPRMAVDLNSVAKGYSSDLLGMLLEQLGYKNFMVEVGGEIVARGRNAGRQPWRVGVDKPIEDNILPGGVLDTVIMLTDKALATSGNYRNYHLGADGRRIVHTINPLTGLSEPTDMLSATVVADRCAIADAYATMFMAMGSVRAIAFARERREVRVYFIYTGSDGKIQRFTNL